MATLRIIGVRHHSPACARLVRHVISQAKPWAVLIEGPSDMNARLDELRLPHTLPIALYSYCLPNLSAAAAATAAPAFAAPSDAVMHAHASWAPFCEYSPEWVALSDGHAAGAQVRFIDLPAWDPAFATVENRYSDHEQQVSQTLRDVALERGFDSTDSLWDHLFETNSSDNAKLETDLADYFDGFRGRVVHATDDDPMAHDRDPVREAYMGQWIAWAMQAAPADATVLVVCGGFHKPALHVIADRIDVAATAPFEPEVPTPPANLARVGSYLVPFSFHRLDSFTGYAAGMPSPGFYQALWQHGAQAGERMMFAAIARLRQRGQRVSTADAIAASQLAQGLAQLRSHTAPTRTDILDGLAGALIKEALRAPPPWSGRGVMSGNTDPYLIEIIHAFTGEARGTLAAGTPRPPLVDDIEQTCRNVGLAWTDKPTTVTVDIYDPTAVQQRQTLYRLLWLEIPGVDLVTRADVRRGKTRSTETWRLVHNDATTATLIERAVYGATLYAAALARITEQMRGADGVATIVAHMERAVRAGYHRLVPSLCTAAEAAIVSEPLFSHTGTALMTLANLHATETALAGGIAPLIRTVMERALWLLEAIDGADAPFDQATVGGIAAIRASLEFELPDFATIAAMCEGVWQRRLVAPSAPPAVRGACLGALWTFQTGVAVGADYTTAARTALTGTPALVLGDFLGGLFALAREAFRDSDLVLVIDERLTALDDEEFLHALPPLRRAFTFFPPAERRALAKRLLNRHAPDQASQATDVLLGTVADPELVATAQRRERSWLAVAAQYHLLSTSEAAS